MKFARYGYDVLLITLVAAILLIVGAFFVDYLPVRIGMITLGVLLAAFDLYFFRDPERPAVSMANRDRLVISPADGKVMLVHPVQESEYLKGDGILIATFLSPLDVHVNRAPISGEIELFRHIHGSFTPAFKEKSSEVNERTHIGIRGEKFPLLLKQIAGSVARRIVAPVDVGDRVEMGDRFGMIKFGSRTDVIVPPNMEVLVEPGQRVVGGVTVLCRLPEQEEVQQPASAGYAQSAEEA